MVTSSLDAPYSYYLLNANLSEEIDRRTIEEMEIDGFTLMEIAGSSAAKKMLESEKNLTHGIFLCGKGNNGGDALVIARYLLQHNIKGTIVFLSGTEDLSPDSAKNLELLRKFDSKDTIFIAESWDRFDSPPDFDFIVDGMLGTGLDSDVRGDYTNAVKWANKPNTPVFAVDIPTGLHVDSGKIMGCAIDAYRTFSFGGRKQGFYLNDGPSVTGIIDYCELPFPNIYKDSCTTGLLDESWIDIPSPAPGKHKYDSGVLYIIAGSEGLTGAAIMAAQSAWAEGLGAVILICPRAILPVFEQTLPSIIKKPVGNRNDYFFKEEHADSVLEIIQEKEGATLLGPGLGREGSTVKFVEHILTNITTDTVIDADGLWCLAQLSDWKQPEQANLILTPHPGELYRLANKNIKDDYQRLNIVRNYAKKHNVTLLAKGMPGFVGAPDGQCYLTNYDTRYFARAGSGDVLAGKVSTFLTLGFAPDRSSAMGLLLGKRKLDHYLEDNQGLPEPKDFV